MSATLFRAVVTRDPKPILVANRRLKARVWAVSEGPQGEQIDPVFISDESLDDIRKRGYEWPRYALVEEYAVTEEGRVDLSATLKARRASRSFCRGQFNEAYAFKRNTGADYSDFTDRFDEYVRMERELGRAIAYLEEIVEALAA